MTELDLRSGEGAERPLEAIAPLQRLTTLISTAIKHQLYIYPKGERSNLMSQSLWLFGSRLTIVADRTTTAGQYDRPLAKMHQTPPQPSPKSRFGSLIFQASPLNKGGPVGGEFLTFARGLLKGWVVDALLSR
jgi:hypothetical protein